jgi:hypothetical protein
MSLLNCILSSNAALVATSAGDWGTVALALSQANRLHTDATLRTSRWLMTQLTAVLDPQTGATEADLLITTLEDSPYPRAREAHRLLSGIGLDLSHPDVQAMLPAIGANWPAGMVAKIQRFGRWTTTPWQDAGLPQAPTAEEIQAVWEPYALRQSLEAVADAAYAGFIARYNAAKAGIDDGTLTTTEQVAAVLTGG